MTVELMPLSSVGVVACEAVVGCLFVGILLGALDFEGTVEVGAMEGALEGATEGTDEGFGGVGATLVVAVGATLIIVVGASVGVVVGWRVVGEDVPVTVGAVEVGDEVGAALGGAEAAVGESGVGGVVSDPQLVNS